MKYVCVPYAHCTNIFKPAMFLVNTLHLRVLCVMFAFYLKKICIFWSNFLQEKFEISNGGESFLAKFFFIYEYFNR